MELGEVKSGYFKRGTLFIFRSSQLGRCHRAIQYNVMRIPQEEPPEKTKKMWDERSQDEITIGDKLRKSYKVKYLGEERTTFHRKILSLNNCVIAGTPDGMKKDGSKWIPIEIKSLNPFRFGSINKPEDLSREYYLQIQGEILVTGAEEGLFVIGNSKTKKDIKDFSVPKDESVLNWIEDRIKYITGFLRKNTIIYPEFFYGSEKCRWCSYKSRCMKDGLKIPKVVFRETAKIKKSSFDYRHALKISSLISTVRTQIEDVRHQVSILGIEGRDILLKYKAEKIDLGKNSFSLFDICEIEGDSFHEHN